MSNDGGTWQQFYPFSSEQHRESLKNPREVGDNASSSTAVVAGGFGGTGTLLGITSEGDGGVRIDLGLQRGQTGAVTIPPADWNSWMVPFSPSFVPLSELPGTSPQPLSRSSGTGMKAYDKKEVMLLYSVEPTNPTLYGAIHIHTKRIWESCEAEYSRLKQDPSHLAFMLKADCPRISATPQNAVHREVFPWSEFELWIKGIAAYFGPCRNGHSFYNTGKTAMGRPIHICEHFETCHNHHLEGLNLAEMCKLMKKTLRKSSASNSAKNAALTAKGGHRRRNVSLNTGGYNVASTSDILVHGPRARLPPPNGRWRSDVITIRMLTAHYFWAHSENRFEAEWAFLQQILKWEQWKQLEDNDIQNMSDVDFQAWLTNSWVPSLPKSALTQETQ
ncbi:hypothetical protein BT69DRAFT_1322863 [Atractiella rhizophila]|nr:hypothetical protein BT69DRAFT_1322863 [Atractiella rhizophila]